MSPHPIPSLSGFNPIMSAAYCSAAQPPSLLPAY